MKHRKNTIQNLIKKENAVVSSIANKLTAIFKSTYSKVKQQKNKNKSKREDKNKEKQKKLKKISQKNIDGLKYEIKLLVAFFGIGTPHIKIKNQPKLSREQILIMDIDFDGLYHVPDVHKLSSFYIQSKQKAVNGETSENYKITDYDLNQIPIWAELKKFNSFRSMYSPISHQLLKINYNPDELNQLNLYDILDLISHHNYEHPNYRMPSQRNLFMKSFAACYGDEFLYKMTLLGKEKEAENLLTYISYIGKTKDKCPPEAYAASRLFNVHHVKNRKNAEEMEDYSQVNNFSNLTLCYAFPHHKVLHTPLEIDLNPNIVFFGSFLREFQIIRNPEKERLYQQGQVKDWKPVRGGR